MRCKVDNQVAGSASVNYALAVLDYFDDHQWDATAAFGSRWVNELRQCNRKQRVSQDRWPDMVQTATRYLADPTFALKLAASVKQRHLGLLGFLLMSCNNLGEVAVALERYEHLIDSVNVARVSTQNDRCLLTWQPLIPNPTLELAMLSMALWVNQARWLCERSDLVGDVDFSFAEPADPGVRQACERTFGGQVRFGQACCQLVAPLAYMQLPVVQRDSQVNALLKVQAEHDLHVLLGPEKDFLTYVEKLLVRRLEENGTVSMSELALELNMAPRTLRHRLDDAGWNFRNLLDHVRYLQAQRHLSNLALPLAQVALMLGFANQSAFQHAFKRWAGCAPGAYRQSLREQPAGGFVPDYLPT